jgi:hypothetical protein
MSANMSGLLEVRRLPDFIRRLILKDRERLSALDETSDGAVFLPAVKRSSSVTCKLSSMPVTIIELGRMENARLMGGIAPCLGLPEPPPADANPGDIDPCRLVGVLSIISCRDVADRTLELREALLAACDILRFKLTRWISSLKFLRKTMVTGKQAYALLEPVASSPFPKKFRTTLTFDQVVMQWTHFERNKLVMHFQASFQDLDLYFKRRPRCQIQ